MIEAVSCEVVGCRINHITGTDDLDTNAHAAAETLNHSTGTSLAGVLLGQGGQTVLTKPGAPPRRPSQASRSATANCKTTRGSSSIPAALARPSDAKAPGIYSMTEPTAWLLNPFVETYKVPAGQPTHDHECAKPRLLLLKPFPFE